VILGKTHLYVVAVGYDKLYKVGITGRLKKRISAHGRANPRLTLVADIEFSSRRKARAAENMLQAEFGDLLHEGRQEIYRLEDNDLRALVEDAANAANPALHSFWGPYVYAKDGSWAGLQD
jgi:hypothetical protein